MNLEGVIKTCAGAATCGTGPREVTIEFYSDILASNVLILDEKGVPLAQLVLFQQEYE